MTKGSSSNRKEMIEGNLERYEGRKNYRLNIRKYGCIQWTIFLLLSF